MKTSDMEYQGKLYGKIGKGYFPLIETSEDIDRLKTLLKAAKCPNCDGSGTIVYTTTPDGEIDDIGPCQWCYERTKLIEQPK